MGFADCGCTFLEDDLLMPCVEASGLFMAIAGMAWTSQDGPGRLEELEDLRRQYQQHILRAHKEDLRPEFLRSTEQLAEAKQQFAALGKSAKEYVRLQYSPDMTAARISELEATIERLTKEAA